MSCLRHFACSFRSTHLLHFLRSASTSIIGWRSHTERISAVLFLASAFSHRHFHSGRYCFLSQHATSPSYVPFSRFVGQCLSWLSEHPVMPAEELFLESRSTAQNSSYVGAELKASRMSRSTCGRTGTFASASYTRRRNSTGTLVYSVFLIKNSSSCMQQNIERQVWGQELVSTMREATLGLAPLDPADLGSNHEPPGVSLMLLTTRPLDRLSCMQRSQSVSVCSPSL